MNLPMLETLSKNHGWDCQSITGHQKHTFVHVDTHKSKLIKVIGPPTSIILGIVKYPERLGGPGLGLEPGTLER